MKGNEYETIRLSANVSVLIGRTNSGLIKTDGGVYVIDTGMGAGSGAAILAKIREMYPPETPVKAIVNTHSHADHIGGDSFLSNQTGCEIWMPAGERGPIENNTIETLISWGGYPIPELIVPVFSSQNVQVSRTLAHNETIGIGDGTLETVPLPGHFLDMLGYIYTDSGGSRTVFLGDSIFGRKYIKKYWIPYILNVTAFKESLKTIDRIKADYYVPSHGEIITEISASVELNMIAVLETETAIIRLLKKPMTAEEIVKEIADLNHMQMKYGQFVLISCTIRSYLSSLHQENRVDFTVQGNRMYWEAV